MWVCCCVCMYIVVTGFGGQPYGDCCCFELRAKIYVGVCVRIYVCITHSTNLPCARVYVYVST